MPYKNNYDDVIAVEAVPVPAKRQRMPRPDWMTVSFNYRGSSFSVHVDPYELKRSNKSLMQTLNDAAQEQQWRLERSIKLAKTKLDNLNAFMSSL